MKRPGRWLNWFLLALLGIFFAWQFWLLGWVLFWKWVDPGTTRFMDIRLSELREKNPDARLQMQWVSYERISPYLKRAIIASEDARFVDHEGFDWEGIQKAMEKNQKRGRTVAGGSTISQQLAKNLFLTPNRSYFRKAEEAAITLMLEALWNRRRNWPAWCRIRGFTIVIAMRRGWRRRRRSFCRACRRRKSPDFIETRQFARC